MTGGPDMGEAADYILSEQPGLDEDVVWGVLVALQDPPGVGTDDVALQLVRTMRPDISAQDARVVLREWRAYASLASEPDWDEE